MNKLQCHLKQVRLTSVAKNLNKATVTYLENGLPRQQQVTAPTEEELLHTIFMIPVDAFPDKKITIKQVHYHGNLLYWNEFLAHNHFAKNRMSFDEFKQACFEKPEKITA
ncbi:hypothetical protein OU798_07605 [Prolixibacteraceae bacterium Z1-6]|uniref:Uncharacterized protein n=1 Tax=Draconibacterium aestuarii TaxID=2998507 RepID=A0A9X3FCR3_9BACT|nr:hypothetical protein [Prolixibacteraceae bacterium Z1-6]